MLSVAKARNTIRLYRWELESMGEYSTTLPSGTTIWKQWKRNINSYRHDPYWVVGQYHPSRGDGMVMIRWFEVVLKQGPKPPDYEPPDWDRQHYYDRGGFDHGIGYEKVGAA